MRTRQVSRTHSQLSVEKHLRAWPPFEQRQRCRNRNLKQSVSQLCVSAWWIFVWTASAAAQFQFDITQQELAIGVDANVVVDEKPAQVNNGMIDVRANVDSWLFSSHGNEANARRFLDNQLDARIAMFDGMFELSDSQTTKLQMAGSFDIVRYFAEADRIRSQFGAQVNQNDFNKVWQEVQPLRQKFQRGLLSTGSMFAKVSKNSLDEKQYREFAGLEAEKLKFAYRSTIKLVLTELEKLAPLRDEQRRQILEVLVDHRSSELPRRVHQLCRALSAQPEQGSAQQAVDAGTNEGLGSGSAARSRVGAVPAQQRHPRIQGVMTSTCETSLAPPSLRSLGAGWQACTKATRQAADENVRVVGLSGMARATGLCGAPWGLTRRRLGRMRFATPKPLLFILRSL